MSEFDDFDLGRRLRDAAGADPDVAAAQDRVQHRVVRARRRRMAAVSGAAAAVIVSIGLVAALGNEGGGDRLETSNSGTIADTIPNTSDQSSTTVDDSTTTSDPRGPATTIPSTTTLPTAPTITTPPLATTATTLPGQVAPGPDPATTTTDETPTSTSTSTPTTLEPTTTVPAPADVTRSYPSVGGSITVRLSGGQMTLVSWAATPGYDTEVHTQKADDIEVRFRSADAESRIRVRLVNGEMVPEIDE